MKKCFSSVFCIIFFALNLNAQCDTGSEPECTCESAEVLCSIGELDGFSSSMSSFQHPDDGPTPFCGPQTQTNNPTWFTFIAWCDNITMEVEFDNCTTVGGFSGAQLAVYEDCSFNNQVDCDDDCSSSGTVSLDMDVEIGESYYVMLDGCFGSACDYEISISPTDCDEFIEDWDEPVTEDLVVCLGSAIIYDVENLSGATSWHWFLDGSEIEVTDIPSYDIVWDTEGVYELCVDASNICLDVDEDPEANCVMITVADPATDEIEVDESPECPNEFMDLFVEEYNMGPQYIQAFIIVDEEGEVVQVNQGTPTTGFTWPTCQMFTVYSINFHEDEEIEVPDVGDDYFGTDCILFCCDETSTTLEFFDEDLPEFDRPPEDVTVDCYLLLEDLDLDEIEIVEVVDNCVEDAEVMGTEVIMADTCNGGTIVREWFFADACNNAVSHTQTITILPFSSAQFLNVPNDTTMSSLEFQNYMFPILEYNNNLPGECNLSGSEMPMIDDNRSGCGGFVVLNYSYTDPCGNTISASQRIDIETDLVATDTIYNICDIDESGFATIEEDALNALITDDITGVTIQYYPTEADLLAGTNTLNFPVNSNDLPEPTIYAFVVDATGCESQIRIAISINNLPDLVFNSENETCLGDADGQIEILNPLDLSSYTLIVNNDTIDQNVVDNLVPGTYQITLVDNLGCVSRDSASILEGIDVNIQDVNIICDNNDTGLDETDDFYVTTFIVTGGSGQFLLDAGPGIIQEPYNYNENLSIDLAADGLAYQIIATDVATGCSFSFMTPILSPCSSDCQISIEDLQYNCNDNLTPLDASDDFYEFELLVSALNGGASNSYNLSADGNLINAYQYNTTVNFTLPVDGNVVELLLVDADISSCTATSITEELTACSDLCQLDIELISTNCVDPNTPADNDDDLFTIEFIATAINGSSQFALLNTGETFNYGNTVTVENNLITNGDVLLEIVDSEDMSCTQSLSVQAPAPCSSPCDVQLTEINILECNDNMTGTNDDDDFFFIEVNITSLLGTGLTYNLEDGDGNTYGPFDYNALVTVGPLSANGQLISFELVDADNASCILEFTASQTSCSDCSNTLELLPDDILILNCLRSEITIESLTNVPATSYLWSGPQSFSSDMASITVSEEGLYTLTVTFDDGCTLTESVDIDSNTNTPVSDAGADQLINCVRPSVTVSGQNSQLGPNVEISWFDENNNLVSNDLEFQTSTPGTYSLQLIDTENGCESEIDFVQVNAYFNEPLAVIYAEPTNILDCNIQSINLSYEAEPNSVYLWQFNNVSSEDPVINITEPTTVTLIALDTVSFCETDSTLVIEDFEVYPTIEFEEIQDLDCIDEMACVTVSTNTINTVEYNWYQANNLLSNDVATYCFDSPGDYIIEIVDLANGCTNDALFTIVAPSFPEISLPDVVTVINDETLDISATVDIPGSSISEILWESDGAILSCYNCLETTILQVQDSTVINLSVTSLEGCVTTRSVLVEVKRIPKIYIPNIFNPQNGDKFTVFASSDFSRVDELLIFDRWGNPVYSNSNFEPNDPDQGWDGTRDGKAIEQGVYVYLVKYELDGRIESIYGTITLIK